MIKTRKPCNIECMKKDIKKNSSKRIKELLYRMDWNQSDLARAVNVSPQSVQQWISGTTSPRGKSLAKLADVSGMPEHWFFMDDSSDVKPETQSLKATDYTNENIDFRKVKLMSLFDRLTETEKYEVLNLIEIKAKQSEKVLDDLIEKQRKENKK